MPNSSGVYANSVQGINNAAAQQNMTPQLNAAGNYGYDPLTGAPLLDKYAAQTKMANLSNPGSLDSQYLSQMQPSMIPGRSPSGPSGRMGPQAPRRKIMTLGPRTAAEYTAENGSPLDNAYAQGNLTNPNAPAPSNPAAPSALPGGGYNVDLAQFDPPADPAKPKMMAKGGAMKIGKRPYLVGEEGPELIMPRRNGEGFVLPADVTAQVLPIMRNVTPRAQGGPMVMQSPDARFAAFTSPAGSGFASRIPQGDTIGTEMARRLAPTPMMADPTGRYQLDPTQPGMPFMPDTVSGPFAEPAAPVTPIMRSDLNRATAGQAQNLINTGATVQSRYPGMTFPDAADPTAPAIPFEQLQSRVAMRGIEAANQQFDLTDRRERDRVQLELANRNARAPIGTSPAMVQTIPGMPAMRPSTQRAINRNLERLYSTPQGAMLAAEQAQQSIEGNIVDTAMLPVGNEGFVPVVRDAAGRQRMAGSFIPNARNTQAQNLTPAQAKELGLVRIQSGGGRITYGRPVTNEDDFQITQIDGPMVEDPISKTMVPGPKQTVRVNKRTGDYEPLRPASAPTQITTAATPSPTAGPPQVRSVDDYNALPKGARYLDPSGKLKVKNS